MDSPEPEIEMDSPEPEIPEFTFWGLNICVDFD